MYSIIKTDSTIKWEGKNGERSITPILTLADEYGGRCQIIIDDHCYKIMIKTQPVDDSFEELYEPTCYIFREVFEALKTLDSKPLSI
jgi:hypothetical protein